MKKQQPPKQHSIPCKECPFRRDGPAGLLGGSPAETFIGQAHGEFWLPCHLHSEYEDPNWKSDTSKPQCAGAATYRANVAKRSRGGLLELPANRDVVFASPAEFLAHHKGITLAQATSELTAKPACLHTMEEYAKIAGGVGFIQLVERKGP